MRAAAVILLATVAAPAQAPGQTPAPTRPRTDSAPPRPSTPSTPAIGTFRDVDELSLADLLDRRVSIAAAGRVQRLEEAPSIVSVITDEEIRRMGARSVSDVLRTVPGFDVTVSNTGLDMLVVRGKRPYEDSDVLILVNGLRLNDAITNQVMVSNLSLPIANVRQIEVVRGPGSAVYGAYAFGGVVNVVTYTPQTLSGVQATAQVGSFGTARASLATGHAWGAFSLGTAVEASTTDGPRLDVAADAQTLVDRLAYAPAGLPPVSLAPGRTRTAVRSLDARINVQHRGTTLQAFAHGDQVRGGYLGLLDILPSSDDNRLRTLGAELAHRAALGTRGAVRLSGAFVQHVQDARLALLPPGFVRQFADGRVVRLEDGGNVAYLYGARRGEANAVAEYAFGRTDQLVVGTGLQREVTFDERAASNYDFVGRAARPETAPIDPIVPRATRTIASVFAQESWSPTPSVGLTAGVRHDQYSDFGGTTNPRIGVVWRLPNAWFAKALYGRAFKAPTFEQLYQNVPGVRRGDPSLRPATITTRELAAGWARGGTRVGVDYFAETVRNRIVAAYGAPESVVAGNEFTFANGGPMRTRGVEVEARQTVGLDHALFGAFTYQAARVIGEAERAPNVPRVLASAGGTLGLSRHLSVTALVMHRGVVLRAPDDLRRDPDVARALGLDLRPRLPAVTLANLNVRLLNFWDTLELAGTVSNLFDARYADPSTATGAPFDYPRPGRALFLKAGFRL